MLSSGFVSTIMRASSMVTVYYLSDDGYFVPVTRPLKSGSNPYMAAIKLALSPPGMEGLSPIPLPLDTSVISVRVQKGIAFLDFSGNLPSKAGDVGDPWYFIINPFIATLFEFPEINKVQVLFGGKVEQYFGQGEIAAPENREDYLGPNSVVIYNGSQNDLQINIFYPQVLKTGFFLVPLSTYISRSEFSLEKVLEVLLVDRGVLNSPFPTGTRILGVKIDSGVAFINFSKSLLTITGKFTDEAISEALRYTASEFGIESIQVLVEGKKVAQIGKGKVDFSKPLLVPENPPGLLPMPKGINRINQ